MQKELAGRRVLLTGASGGLGRTLALELSRRGAHLLLTGRRAETLRALQGEIRDAGGTARCVVADLGEAAGREEVVAAALREFAGVDILINAAGSAAFTDFATQDAAQLESIFKINVLAPMSLTQAVLPMMRAQAQGQIVNIGSTFGSIAFAWFIGYSASKFALRGFSEALRRELEGSGIRVTYIAPRAVRTELNSPAVYRMADKVKMNIDSPESVARRIANAIEAGKKDVYLGFPESLFVRINALLPRLVDKALRKQNRISGACLHEPTVSD